MVLLPFYFISMLEGHVFLSNTFYCVQLAPHDVVILKPNKAELGSAPLGQGVVYRIKVQFNSFALRM
jgi:hypothetical protein